MHVRWTKLTDVGGGVGAKRTWSPLAGHTLFQPSLPCDRCLNKRAEEKHRKSVDDKNTEKIKAKARAAHEKAQKKLAAQKGVRIAACCLLEYTVQARVLLPSR